MFCLRIGIIFLSYELLFINCSTSLFLGVYLNIVSRYFVMFFIENLLSSDGNCLKGILFYRWRTALLWRAFFTTATVAIFLRAMIDVCLSDKCGLFGKGGLIMFDAYSASISYHLVDVPPVFILAVVGGLLGSLFNFMTNKVLRIYNVINE